MQHEENLIEELRALGHRAGGNGTAALSVTVYGNVKSGTESPYGPCVRQEVSLTISIPNGSWVQANEQTIETALESVKRQIEHL